MRANPRDNFARAVTGRLRAHFLVQRLDEFVVLAMIGRLALGVLFILLMMSLVPKQEGDSVVYPAVMAIFGTVLYIWFFRGTPVIVQIFFIYFGANLFLNYDLFPRTAHFWFVAIDGAVLAGTVALAVNEGAYMSEIVRAGIGSVDSGQMEAAKMRVEIWRTEQANNRMTEKATL